MATSSLTPSDLDAIRLILREELEAHERETVPPEEAEADEFCTLTADDFAVTDIFLTDCQCLFDVTLPDEARLLRKGGDCPAALRVGDRTNLHLVLDRCRVRKVAEGPKPPAVSRAPAEQPASEWEEVLGSELGEGTAPPKPDLSELRALVRGLCSQPLAALALAAALDRLEGK